MPRNILRWRTTSLLTQSLSKITITGTSLLCLICVLKILSRITRKVLISFPGLTLLILGLLNWYWTIHGLNLVYSEYEGGALSVSGCGSFVHSVVWINLVITGLVSLPVFWVLFWMVLIKLTCILLGVISPNLLIKLKKATAKLRVWRKEHIFFGCQNKSRPWCLILSNSWQLSYRRA